MRKWHIIQLDNAQLFVDQLIEYGDGWNCFLLLNSNTTKNNKHLYRNFELIAACDEIYSVNSTDENNFEVLKEFCNHYKDWTFGHFSYDLKNDIENLVSSHPDRIRFPEMFFFIPRYVFIVDRNFLKIGYLEDFNSKEDVLKLYTDIIEKRIKYIPNMYIGEIKHNFSKEEYIKGVEKIKQHILRGDVYELNFCTEFFAENVKIEPSAIFQKLNKLSPAPFSGYYKIYDKYLLSASPERFLAKRGTKIISQPIKGTIKRGISNIEDNLLKNNLETNEKERAENIMIVDLVRNDLSRTAKKGSVEVEELCKIYSYKYVHQMISTIVSEIDSGTYHAVDVIRNAFPMGSMTGAPKVKAMELIEQYERSKRGLYSGCIGYFSPELDFDFNVVIRSILFNKSVRSLSFSVGSAITFKSVPENEYQECLLKAKAIKEVLSINQPIC